MRPLARNEIAVLPAGPVSLKESNLGQSPEYGDVLTHWENDFFILLLPIDDTRDTTKYPHTPSTLPIYATSPLDIPAHITMRILGVSSDQADNLPQRQRYTHHNIAYIPLAHDQTHKAIGHSPDHRVMGVFPATKQGLSDLQKATARSTVQLVVLK
jgi:hypothetical protein